MDCLLARLRQDGVKLAHFQAWFLVLGVFPEMAADSIRLFWGFLRGIDSVFECCDPLSLLQTFSCAYPLVSHAPEIEGPMVFWSLELAVSCLEAAQISRQLFGARMMETVCNSGHFAEWAREHKMAALSK
jgi:hypothetical protein